MLESCAVDRLSLFVYFSLSLCLHAIGNINTLLLNASCESLYVARAVAREFFIRLSGVRVGRGTPRGRCAVEPPGPGTRHPRPPAPRPPPAGPATGETESAAFLRCLNNTHVDTIILANTGRVSGM